MPKLQLVKPSQDDGTSAADQWYLPLDLLAVASAAEREGATVRILDGTNICLDQVIKHLAVDVDVVGFTFTALSIKTFQRLAQIAHKRGVKVIVGGQAATATASNLVEESFIDLVIQGDGEPAIRDIVKQMVAGVWDPENIANAFSFKGGKLVAGPQEVLASDDIGQISRSAGGLNANQYVERFSYGNTLKNISASRATNIFSKRGCGAVCSFCARTDKKLRARSSHLVLEEMARLTREWGIDYIIDTSDSWAIDSRWVKEFATARSAWTEPLPPMMVFADSRHITPEIPSCMKLAGVNNILLGVESASPRILLRNGKSSRPENVQRIIRELTRNGIGVSVSLVLGLIGENEKSLDTTRRFAETVSQWSGVRVYANVIIPLPSSPAWNEFLAHKPMKQKWSRAINYNLEEVRDDFIDIMTDIPGGTAHLFNIRDEILARNDLDFLEFAR